MIGCAIIDVYFAGIAVMLCWLIPWVNKSEEGWDRSMILSVTLVTLTWPVLAYRVIEGLVKEKIKEIRKKD